MWLISGISRMWLCFEGLGQKRACLLIFLVGVSVRMALSLLNGTYADLARYEMERAALSLARTGRLADPYLIPTGFTAHVTPGYPLLLSAIFHLFGTGYSAEIIKELCSSAAVAAQYALLPLIAPAFGITFRAGLAAGLFGALLPVKYSTEVMGDWEAPYSALAMVLLIYTVALTWRSRRFTVLKGVCQGAGWGIALLISSALLPVLAVTTVLGFFRTGSRTARPYLTYAAALGLTTVLCLVPWAWRNQVRLGAPIFTRSNFGLEIRLSNNDFASPVELQNLRTGVYERFHPFLNEGEAQAVRSMGEVAYNRDRLHRALMWIRTHPRRLAVLTAQRFLYTWFPNRSPRDILLCLITIASTLGLFALWHSSPKFALLLVASIASYTLVYYLVQVSARYRYPVDWILLLATASWATGILPRLIAPLAQSRKNVREERASACFRLSAATHLKP